MTLKSCISYGGAYFWLKLADFQKMQNRRVSNFVQKGSILGCKFPDKLCKSKFWLKITEYCSHVSPSTSNVLVQKISINQEITCKTKREKWTFKSFPITLTDSRRYGSASQWIKTSVATNVNFVHLNSLLIRSAKFYKGVENANKSLLFWNFQSCNFRCLWLRRLGVKI